MSKQIVVWRSTDTPANNATEYCAAMGNSSRFSTEATQGMHAATAGIFRNLRVVLSAAPGTGNSWVITLRVNGADTALSVTLTDADTDEENTGTDVAVAAGDFIALEFDPDSAPTTMTPSVSLEFDSTTAGASMYGHGSQNVVAGSVATSLFGGDTTANWQGQFSVNAVEGDLTALYCSLDGAPGTGSYTFTIEKNNVMQDGTGGTVNTVVTIANAATTGNASFTLPCSPGDIFRLFCVPNTPGTNRRPRYGVELIADTPGVSNFCSAPDDNLNNGATEFFSAHGDASGAFNATESTRQATAGVAFSLSHARFGLSAAPGAGQSYAFALRVNGSDTGLAASIADANTTAFVSSTVNIVADDLLSFGVVPGGTPAVGNLRWSFSQEIIEARPRSHGYIF